MSRNFITNVIYTGEIPPNLLILSVVNITTVHNSRFLLGVERSRRTEDILCFKAILEGSDFSVGVAEYRLGSPNQKSVVRFTVSSALPSGLWGVWAIRRLLLQNTPLESKCIPQKDFTLACITREEG